MVQISQKDIHWESHLTNIPTEPNRRNVLSLYVDLASPYLTRTDETYCLSMLIWHHPISREQTKRTVSLCWSGITLFHENRRNVPSLYVGLASPCFTRTDEMYCLSMLIWHHPISREQTKRTVSLCWSGITLFHENRRNVPSLYVGLASPCFTRTDEMYCLSMLIWHHPVSREQTKCTVSLC